jgi:hypothetical protein
MTEEFEAARERLTGKFPTATPEEVTDVLRDSYRVVARVVRRVRMDKIEELATLRLEARTRVPAAY